MELKVPAPEQTYRGLRAMKTVALADGGLDESEWQVMEAVQQVFGTYHQLGQLELVTLEELAQALPDPQIRCQLVNGLIVMSLIDRRSRLNRRTSWNGSRQRLRSASLR